MCSYRLIALHDTVLPVRLFVDRQVVIQTRGGCLDLDRPAADEFLEEFKVDLAEFVLDADMMNVPENDLEDDLNETYYNEPIPTNSPHTYKRILDRDGWKCVVIYKKEAELRSRFVLADQSKPLHSMGSEIDIYVQEIPVNFI